MRFGVQDAGGPGSSGQDAFSLERAQMVERQIRRRGVSDLAVLGAMGEVPRHEFVAESLRSRAYDDGPLPIGGGQTISQPYIVAAMTQALELAPTDRVLDIGTGCGYQAALLSRIARIVYSVEVRQDLATSAAERLARLGYLNVHVHCGDGTLGLPQAAPFDAILVAAAAPEVPEPLLAQLAPGRRLVLPVGGSDRQQLKALRRSEASLDTVELDSCQFVPLIGRYGWRDTHS
jgi:protein-L-isoaspartate(D-aspartate) O-methyltransferase